LTSEKGEGNHPTTTRIVAKRESGPQPCCLGPIQIAESREKGGVFIPNGGGVGEPKPPRRKTGKKSKQDTRDTKKADDYKNKGDKSARKRKKKSGCGTQAANPTKGALGLKTVATCTQIRKTLMK